MDDVISKLKNHGLIMKLNIKCIKMHNE